jgi:multiple sugar transport system permease protein
MHFFKKKTRESIAGYLFVMPNFIGFLIFTSIPIIASLTLAFMKWDLLSPAKFVGFDNFIRLFSDKLFWKYTGNTFFFMMIIPIEMAGALAVALALNQKIKGIKLFRTIFFLPTICSGVAICILWKWLYNTDFGLINFVLAKINIHGPAWLADAKWAKPALMTMTFWTAMGGYNMILYLAGLQGIPPQLYEAADIDGASGWQKFWNITWPMLSPTTFFICIMSVIGGFQGGFQSAYVMTGGGPDGATTTISYYIYNNAYAWFNMGYAAAIAWMLFVLIFIVTIFNWKYGGKVVHY